MVNIETIRKANRQTSQAKYRSGKGKETSAKYYKRHRDEIKARSKKWAETHREQRRVINLRDYYKHRKQRRAYALKAKELRKYEILTYYGNGKCACVRCGFTDSRALTIDHINGGGNQDRKKKKNFYSYLYREKFPAGYQTLCMNCQFIKKKEKEEHRWAPG